MEKAKRAVQRRSVADLVSESLIRGNCPVDAVVISTSGKGMTDLSESVEVNVLGAVMEVTKWLKPSIACH